MDRTGKLGAKAPTLDTTALKALPLDALGLVALLSSVYFFQVWGLTLHSGPLSAGFHIAMMAMSGLGILLPRLHWILIANAAVFAASYLIASPVASNNQTTAFFFSLVVLGATLAFYSTGPERRSRDELFSIIAWAGRWILPSMYFFGIYHKINADFLDPTVSCAVALYKALFDGSWLSNWSFGHHGAIYATFVIEGIAMVALFIPRLKVYGMLIGIPFHLIIGFTGYAYYKDFSTIVLLLYALFIPREAYDDALAALAGRLGGRARALRLGRLALVVFVIAYVAVCALRETPGLVPTHASMVPFFALYGIAFYLFAVICTPRDGGTRPKRAAAWLLIVPLLYFLNGFSPYLGLKTESSLAMYSNLHTEGDRTNHLINGVLPGTFGYQSDLVWPTGSNSAAFDAAFVGPGRALVRYELDRMLAVRPGLVVTIRSPEGMVSTDANWTNTYLASGPTARKFLTFKPVDFSRPKVCTH